MGGKRVTEFTIGMWMYHNGGGKAIQDQIIEQLNERDIRVLNDLHLQYATAKNGHISCNGVNMENLDLYFSYNAGQQTNYQVYLYQMLNYSVPCVNSFEAFELTEDKFKTSHLLNRHGITTADYQLCHSENLQSAREILCSWGGKAVFKPTNGWGGKGLVKLESVAALNEFLSLLNHQHQGHFYLEKFIDYDNTDFRIDLVDGEFVSCYGRKAQPNQWKTNISSGGSIMMREANDEVVALATRAAKVTGLDIAGVDLIYDRERERYLVLEVNGIPAFATLEQEKMGLDFNHKKIEKVVNLIERKVKGKSNEAQLINPQTVEPERLKADCVHKIA